MPPKNSTMTSGNPSPNPDQSQPINSDLSWEYSSACNTWSSSGYTTYEDYPDLYDLEFYYDWDPQLGLYSLTFDNNPDLTELITANRYIQGRLPVREDANPRGKYPRKPLPWSHKKLSEVTEWKEDADIYQEQLWHEQRETQRYSGHNRPVSTKKNAPDSKKKKMSNPTYRINKPHYLTALDAMAKRGGHSQYYICCYDCPRLLREARSKQRRDWRPRAIADGVEEIANEMGTEMGTEEAIAWEIDYSHDDKRFGPHCPSMNDIVKWRGEDPVYIVRSRAGRKGKVRKAEKLVVDNAMEFEVGGGLSHGDGVDSGGDDVADQWEYLDEGWDSESTGSVWVEVEEGVICSE